MSQGEEEEEEDDDDDTARRARKRGEPACWGGLAWQWWSLWTGLEAP